jgi:peptidoglycan/LPS O-acetylase OafA/YrhL
MNDIPLEFAGIPAGALVIGAVAAMEQAGLPSRWAGLTAIAVAFIIGLITLTVTGQPPMVAAGKALIWGLAIVSVHASVINPIKDAAPVEAPTPVPPTPPAVVAHG